MEDVQIKLPFSFFSFPTGYGRELFVSRTFIDTEEKLYALLSESYGIVDAFVSVYAFRAPRLYSSAYVDKVFFDFDAQYSGNPYLDAKILSDWCDEFNLKHCILSSGRGYHVYIFTKPLTNNQRGTLGNFQQAVIRALKIRPDFHFTHGNLQIMSRCPFTVHMETGRLCLPICRSDFVKGQDYVERLRNNRDGELIIDGKELLDLNQFLVEDQPLRRVSYLDKNKFSGSIFVPEAELPACIQQILKKKAPEHYERYYLTTFFHWLASFGSYDMEQDQEVGLIEELIQFYSTLEWEDFDENKTRYQVENIVKEKYRMPNCSWVISNGDCPGLCGHYR